MDKKKQMHAPVYEALEKLKKRRVVPFDVPGHKRGRGNPELVELLGEKCVSLDVNSMKPLDNLCHPVSVIKEAEELAAEAFRADHAFFMVGGTTSSVQGMVLSCCKAGDKIILPRNVHKSVINALVLCGAIPVYVNPEVDNRLGISLGMEVSEVEKAIVATDRGQPFDNHVTFENGTGADANVRPHHAKRSDLNVIVMFGSNIDNAGMMDFGHDYPFAGPLEPISSSNKKMSPLPRENARAKFRPHFVVKP